MGCVHSSAETASHRGGTHSVVNTGRGGLRRFSGKYKVVNIGIYSYPEQDIDYPVM